jgi:4-amino-4-deoxy-L-arabinose transferase-like glycosyltransferase
VGEKVSLFRDRLGQKGKLFRAERIAPEGKTRERRFDPRPAFLGLEGADGIDQPPARFEMPHGGVEQRILHRGECGKIGGAAQMRNVGVAADGAGGAAGRIEQHRIEGLGALPARRIRRDEAGGEPETGEIFLKPRKPRRIALDRRHLRPSGGELGGLAAGRGAEIEDAFPGLGAKQPRRERGGDVLDEEAALGEAREGAYGRSRRQAPGAGGQAETNLEARLFVCPLFIICPGEIERRLAVVHLGDHPRPLAPAPPEPRGRVEAGRVELVEHGFSHPRDAAQHGIDKPGEGFEATEPGERHRGRHRGMGWGVEKKEGCRAEPEHVAHPLRGSAAKMGVQHRIERAEIAERGGGETMGRGPVARGEAWELVERRIEGAALIEHRGEEMKSGFTGGITHGALSWLSARGEARGKMAERLSAALCRAPRLVLLLFALVCWLPGFTTIPPTDRDESRFAQATKQMLETGDLVRIMNGEEPRNRKPIGIYWLQLPFAAAARRAGLAAANPIWPYRLPSLLGALLAVFATRRLGALLFSAEVGLWAGLLLAASLLLGFEARLAKTDAALLGATTAAIALLAEAAFAPERFRLRHALSFWAALGAGILIKGPITPMVVAFPLAASFWQGRAAQPWRALRPAWGLPLLLLLVLPWFAAIGIATHGQFFAQAVGGDLGRKLAGGDDAHGAPFGTYLGLVFLTFFPGSLLLIPAMRTAFREARHPAFAFLLAWLVPSWLIFELVPTKLPHYVLPLYPALALLCAAAIGEDAPALSARLSRVIFGVVLVGMGGILAALAAVSEFPSPRLLLGLVPLLPLGFLAWLSWRMTDLRRLLGAALLTAPFLYAASFGVELPHLRGIWLSARLAQDAATLGPGRPFGAAGYAEPSLRFLAGTSTRFFASGAEAADFLATTPGAVVAVERGSEAAFQSEAARLSLTLHPLGAERGFNYSKGRRVTLTLYEAAGASAASAPASREVK